MIRRTQGGWAFVVLTALVLLMVAFQAVVRRSVDQGAARRADVARQSDALSVCKRLPGRDQRARCRAGMG